MNICSVPPPPPEDDHEEIYNLNTTNQGMQTRSYEMEVLAQVNGVLTSYNSVVMEQLAQMTVTMNAMKGQFNTLSSNTMNPKRTKSKFYCWSCRRNYNRGSKTYSAKKTGHREYACYKKRLNGSENRCKWWLEAINNKIEISNPKISLINCIRTPPISPCKKTIEISDSGANIYTSKQKTTTD